MGLDAVARPSMELNSLTDIWGHMLFWSLLMSVLIYVIGGVSFSLSVPVLKKRLLVLVPVLYIVYGLFRLLFVEAIACAVVASIYILSGWKMMVGVAIAWGLGLSVLTNLLGVLISSVPLYSFL